MAINGLVVMTPTSIASTGTGNSSSINADGSVDFASCATLSLNGVFTSSYDNYMVVMRHVRTASADNVYGRLRASGTDNTTATSYVSEYLIASSTTVSAARLPTDSWYLFGSTSTAREGGTIFLFGPNLAQATAFRTLSVTGTPYLLDNAGTHNQTTSYDGITFTGLGSNAYTGLVTVFGFNQ